MAEYLFHSNWLERINQQDIFIFFDFDGTLVPIMKNPDDCYLSEHTKEILSKLKEKTKICIISGRDIKDLKKRASIEGICYCGSHGLQIEGYDINYFNPETKRLKPIIDEAYILIKEMVKGFEGAIVEKKSFSFTLHFRQVNPAIRKKLKKYFFEIINTFKEKEIKIQNGKMVFEILPAIDWNKGKSISFILKKFDKKVLPIFVGDDLTDETAFCELKDYGLTIKVGNSKKTVAKYFLKNQAEVYKFIKIMNEVLNV